MGSGKEKRREDLEGEGDSRSGHTQNQKQKYFDSDRMTEVTTDVSVSSMIQRGLHRERAGLLF